MDDEELEYVSSSPLLDTAPVKPKLEDELDLPILQRIQSILGAQIAAYDSIDALTVSEQDLTVQQQLAVAQAVKFNLQQVKATVDSIIENIKEKYRDQ